MDKETRKIIKLVNKGDNQAISDIIENYKLMIYSIIKNYELTNGDYIVSIEDLFQEGCIALIEACNSYKENSKTKFSTYAYVVIERSIQRAFFRMVRPYRLESSFDKYDYTDKFDSIHYQIVNDSDSKHYSVNELVNDMQYATELDREILRLRIQNYTYKEIAEKLGITVKKVDNRIFRLKRFWKQDK